MTNKDQTSVLPSKYSGGPHGLGEIKGQRIHALIFVFCLDFVQNILGSPDDRTLRKVEKEVIYA